MPKSSKDIRQEAFTARSCRNVVLSIIYVTFQSTFSVCGGITSPPTEKQAFRSGVRRFCVSLYLYLIFIGMVSFLEHFLAFCCRSVAYVWSNVSFSRS